MTSGAASELARHVYRVDPETIVRYAGASGDFTSFHYDLERARRIGYDRLFAMGMLAAGNLGTLAASVPGATIRAVSFRFLARSWVGRDVTCTVRTSDEPTVWTLDAVDSEGEPLVSGRAEVELSR